MDLSPFLTAAGRPARAGILGAALFAALAVFAFGPALAAGPFAGMQGTWAGGGTISNKDGTKERMSCQVQYTTADDGNNLQQTLRCSSASYQFHVNAYVKSNGGSLSGNWSETTRNVSGPISGSVSGNRINIHVGTGSAFSATMTMVTNGGRQSVTIVPKGTDITQISVSVGKG